ncbi:MAG: hypothetical protein ACKOEX_02645, partial [Planctomycetia bacterium]
MPFAASEQSRITAVNDSLVFRRARTAALSGLAIQVGLVAATGLVALWADSQAIYAAAWHMAGGLAIWIMLSLIYQQHETERSQRLAAEKLSDTTKAAAIFGNLSDDLDAATARLERLYRLGLPVVSGIVAFYLLVAGCALLWFQVKAAVTGGGDARAGLSEACDPVGLMFVMAAIAFSAFVSARWISGYSRQRAWQLLRGGASYLMSCFVVALLLFAGAASVAVAVDQRIFSGLALA